jgi:hypothetical protein
MNNVKKSLENIVKRYALPIGITALQTPLHEGIHAGLAKILPHSTATGIVLSNKNFWYTKPLKYLTGGFYDTADLPGADGITKMTYAPDFLGYMSHTIASAAPEIATMTLGFYWIKKGINNISTKGKKIHSFVLAGCGSSLISDSFYYLKSSLISPGASSDYLNFTKGVLQMAHAPECIAPYLTFMGAAGMLAASLYLAKIIPSKDNDLDFPNIK